MDLFQCIPTRRKQGEEEGNHYGETDRYYRAESAQSQHQIPPRHVQSVDRDVRGQQNFGNNGMRAHRRTSLPATQNNSRRVRNESARSNASSGSNNGNGVKHWGSSLSINSENSVHELTRRTLAAPSPATMRRTGGGNPNTLPTPRRNMPTLPSMKVEGDAPKLADYLAKPRLVSTLGRGDLRPREDMSHAHHLHAAGGRRLSTNERPAYRNLRLGNFMEHGSGYDEGSAGIPDVLRQYYLDTYLNSCDACESQTHHNPTSPIQRGM